VNSLIGFLIALAVGLTGIGGGSFTVPALVLIVGMPSGEAVATAFVFAAALRIIAAPFYLYGKHAHARYFWLLVAGATPGLMVGTYLLHLLSDRARSPIVFILLGSLLAVTSAITFVPSAQNPGFARRNSSWLPVLAFPIGIEFGFSSAGAGALGTVLLLNYSELNPTQVVGTDILFGLVLAILGSAFHWEFGGIESSVVKQLLVGGIPGVILGCLLARRLAAGKLKLAVGAIAIFAGLQLVWSGIHTLLTTRTASLLKLGLALLYAVRRTA
jgi:uncharacterized membrane protein YfcA